MKKKSTIWTYVKRMLLIVVALVVILFVSVYFLDVYKVSSNVKDYHNAYEDYYWEELERNGFVHFDDIIYEKNKADVLNEDEYEFPFDGDYDYVECIQAARYLEEVDYIHNYLITESDFENTTEYQEAYQEMKTKYASYRRAAFMRENFTEKTVLSNDRYELKMNLETTTFQLIEKDPTTGEELQTWLSNPESVDESASNIQNSLFTITCVDGNKAATKTPITYNSFINSTNLDTTLKYHPSFYINLVEDKEGNIEKVLVYYELYKKGVDYTWFPEVISVARLKELFDRCNEKVKANKAENGQNAVLKDSKNVVIEGLYYGPEFNAAGFSKETTALYSLVINTIYQKIDNIEVKRADGSVYTEEEIDDHILNKECKYLRDENGKVVEDEDGNKLPGYTECEICNQVKLKIKNYTTLSQEAITALYRMYYEWCDYDINTDYVIDSGVEKQEANQARMNVALEYTLSENGLEVKIPGNSVTANTNKTGDPYMITSMELLPYFTAIKSSNNKANQGYMVIPDGSGVIMEFNNGKANYGAYSKRIYSSDLAFTSYTVKADTSDLLLPMYAYVFDQTNPRAIIAEAKDGAAQVAINADTANRGSNTYNHASFSITFRESQRIVIGTTSYNRTPNTQYTENGAFSDYTFSYMCLDTSEYDCSYSGVAKFYRDLIVGRSEGKLDVNADKTTKAILNLDVLGAYSYDTNFLGIGYTGKGTLTTVEQLDTIIDEITKLGVEHINVYYKGWRNTGLKAVSFEKIKVSKLIGGKKALLDLINKYNEEVNIYPYLEFTEYQDYQESFGRTHYTSRDVGGDYSTRFPYELNSNVFNKKADEIRVLSPAYYRAFSQELATNYSKLLGVNTLALSGLGSQLAGDYRKKLTVFKANAVEEQIASFDILREAGVTDIAIETPYAYALEYASNAYNVPYQSTQYEILDYNIPFYQLVINGLFDYSGQSINENVEKGLVEHTMRCIETGSNPAFTFSYDDSSELLQTDYNTYYFTLYSRWLEDVKTICDELNELGIYNCKLVQHERLANEVYKVTYQNDVETIEIVLNYQRVAWTDGELVVPAKSYKKVN